MSCTVRVIARPTRNTASRGAPGCSPLTRSSESREASTSTSPRIETTSAVQAIRIPGISAKSEITNASTAAALGGVEYVASAAITNAATSQTGATEQCPSGTFVTGGGGFGSAGGTVQAINSLYPIKVSGSTVPNGWHVDMNNSDTSSHTFTVYAICAPLTSPASF